MPRVIGHIIAIEPGIRIKAGGVAFEVTHAFPTTRALAVGDKVIVDLDKDGKPLAWEIQKEEPTCPTTQ